MYQAEFIDNLETIEKRLTAYISGQSDLFEDFFPFDSSDLFDLDEEMRDITETGPRSSRKSPDTPIEGSPSHSNTELLDLDEIRNMIDGAETRQRDRLLYSDTETFGPGEITGTAKPTSPKITEAPNSPPPDLSPKGSPPDGDDL